MLKINLLKTLETEKKDAIWSMRVPSEILHWFRQAFGSEAEAGRTIIKAYLALVQTQGKHCKHKDLERAVDLLRRYPSVVPHDVMYPMLDCIKAVLLAHGGGPPGPREAQAALKPIIEVAQRVMNPKGRAA